MSIYLGSNKIKDLYFRSQKIGSIYLGSQKVYSSAIVPPAPSIPSVQIGNRLWSTVYVDEEMCGLTAVTSITRHDKRIYMFRYSDLVNVTFTDNWRIPNISDYNDLVNTVGANNGNSLLSTLEGGTNSYGLNLYWTGMWRNSKQSVINTTRAYFADLDGSSQVNISSGKISYGNWGGAVPFRLVKNA